MVLKDIVGHGWRSREISLPKLLAVHIVTMTVGASRGPPHNAWLAATCAGRGRMVITWDSDGTQMRTVRRIMAIRWQ